MKVEALLSKLTRKILSNIDKANQKVDLAALQEQEELLAKTDRLKKRIENINKLLLKLFKQSKSRRHKIKSRLNVAKERPSDNNLSARAKGKKRRNVFLKMLYDKHGIRASKTGQLYETTMGVRFGIASASYLSRYHNKWFLGLPAGICDVGVLLCEQHDGNMLIFILPKKFFINYEKFLSVSNKQNKFNIQHDGGDYLLFIPGRPKIRLNKFINNYESFK